MVRLGWKFSLWIIRTGWRMPIVRAAALNMMRSAAYRATVKQAKNRARPTAVGQSEPGQTVSSPDMITLDSSQVRKASDQ